MKTVPKKTSDGDLVPHTAAELVTEPTAQPPVNISADQVRQAAIGGLALLSRETTLIPGNLRQQVSVLELVLRGLAAGNLMVASPEQLAVSSEVKQPAKD